MSGSHSSYIDSLLFAVLLLLFRSFRDFGGFRGFLSQIVGGLVEVIEQPKQCHHIEPVNPCEHLRCLCGLVDQVRAVEEDQHELVL